MDHTLPSGQGICTECSSKITRIPISDPTGSKVCIYTGIDTRTDATREFGSWVEYILYILCVCDPQTLPNRGDYGHFYFGSFVVYRLGYKIKLILAIPRKFHSILYLKFVSRTPVFAVFWIFGFSIFGHSDYRTFEVDCNLH